MVARSTTDQETIMLLVRRCSMRTDYDSISSRPRAEFEITLTATTSEAAQRLRAVLERAADEPQPIDITIAEPRRLDPSDLLPDAVLVTLRDGTRFAVREDTANSLAAVGIAAVEHIGPDVSETFLDLLETRMVDAEALAAFQRQRAERQAERRTEAHATVADAVVSALVARGERAARRATIAGGTSWHRLIHHAGPTDVIIEIEGGGFEVHRNHGSLIGVRCKSVRQIGAGVEESFLDLLATRFDGPGEGEIAFRRLRELRRQHGGRVDVRARDDGAPSQDGAQSQTLPACCHAPDDAPLAHRLYAAYNRGGDPETSGLNYQSKPCPEWSDLPENVRAKWGEVATAEAVLEIEGFRQTNARRTRTEQLLRALQVIGNVDSGTGYVSFEDVVAYAHDFAQAGPDDEQDAWVAWLEAVAAEWCEGCGPPVTATRRDSEGVGLCTACYENLSPISAPERETGPPTLKPRENWTLGNPPVPGAIPCAHMVGPDDGWSLWWGVIEPPSHASTDIDWPFGPDDIATRADLEALGFHHVE